MPTQLVCPICGKEFECNEPHDGPHDVLSPVETCPLNKGAIYVYVKDNLQQGVPGVKTVCAGTTLTTDSLGFAAFEQLEENSYDTSIALDQSGEAVTSKFYATTRTSTRPKVERGKITMVEFAVNRYASLEVKLMGPNVDTTLPGARVELSSPGHTPDESAKELQSSKAEFHRLKPTERYKVVCTLVGDLAKSFKLETSEFSRQTVTATKMTEVVFRVVPQYWVELVLEDPNDDKLEGSVVLRQDKVTVRADKLGRTSTHVPDLTAGTVDIDDVILTESREFVALS